MIQYYLPWYELTEYHLFLQEIACSFCFPLCYYVYVIVFCCSPYHVLSLLSNDCFLKKEEALCLLDINFYVLSSKIVLISMSCELKYVPTSFFYSIQLICVIFFRVNYVLCVWPGIFKVVVLLIRCWWRAYLVELFSFYSKLFLFFPTFVSFVSSWFSVFVPQPKV